VNRKKLWLLILTTVILTSFISGCIGGGQFGAPSTGGSVTIKGIVVAPDNNCFTDACSNPSIVEGEPLPNADIILKGNNGQTLTGKTDCAGNYQISGLTDDGYILYANRGEVWIKKTLSPVTGDGGEANYITTAQVILWEVIENTNPGAIAIKDIPTAIPFDAIPQEFIDAVKAALADCRDAQKDPTCLALAKDIAVANFGAPCGCIEPTSTPKPAPNCPIPTAVIGVPQSVEGSDGEFKFDASGSIAGGDDLTITNYKWDFGDGVTLETTEPIVQHQYSETGTYQVTLVVVNSCGSSSASVGVSVTYQKTITYTLTTNVSPKGSGTVSGAGIYSAGSSAEVTATPAAGYKFDHWEGDLTGNTNPDSITMNSNKSVTAVFVPVNYTLTITIVGEGSVTKEPLVFKRSKKAKGPDVSTWPAGTIVQLAANPANGWSFAGWSEDLTGANNPENITMNSNKRVTVTFNENATYNVFYDANGGTGAPTDPSSPYFAGVTVTVVSGDPTRDNYTFAGWLYNGTTYTAGQTFQMPANNVTLVAQWTQDNQYTVTYDANGGTGAPTDPSSPYFAGVTVTIVSGDPTRDNYTFAGWLYNGTTYTAGQTFQMPANNVTLVAQWTENVCTPADITGFTVTSECSCPEYQSRCVDCENCKECTITISNVSATGTEPIQYNYGYKKAGSSDYSMSGWTTVNGYTFTDIEECNSRTYDVIVKVKSDCSTSDFDDSLTKPITLDGGQCEKCCKFDFFSGGGNQKAKWDFGWDLSGRVKVQFQIKNVCQHERINLKVEVYKKVKHGNWVLHGTDNTTFTNMEPNSGGNITRNSEWESTTITGWELGYSYEIKFTITEAQGYCSGYSQTVERDF
jgi:uncharacterized repeat protein (TIGR02543 family)